MAGSAGNGVGKISSSPSKVISGTAGGKGGAKNAGQPNVYKTIPDAPAQPQMNNPTAPNVMQQSATALTDATQAATAGTKYQPMQVGTRGGFLKAQGDMGTQQVNVGNVGTQGGFLRAQGDMGQQRVDAERVGTQGGYQRVNTGGTTQSVGTEMGSKQAIGRMGTQQVGTDMGSRLAGARDVVAGQLAGTDLSAYTNPYESQVVQQSMADMERARKIQQMQQGAKMSAAGAFGGSRHGIAEAETNRAFFDRAGAMAGQLRQQGFNQAQQMAQQDIASRMQAGLANQATQLAASQANQQAEQTGLQRMLQAGMANQAAEQQGLQRQLAASQSNQQAEQTGLQRQLQAGMSNQQAQQADFNRRLQAETANQRALETSRARQLQAGMANQQAGLTAQQANVQAEQQGLQRQLAASQSNQQALEASRARQLQAGMSNQQTQLAAQRANQAAEQQGLGRRLQASQSNQQALEQSRARQLQAQMANQQAGLGAAGQRLAATGQLGQLARQGFDMGRTLQGDVMRQGTMQQMMQQQLIDAAKQQFAGYTSQPTNTIGLLSQALGASTIPQSQQTRRDLGFFDYATLASNMFGGGR